MTACRAPKYATLARAHGWAVELTEVNNVTDTDYGDVVASSPEPGHVDLELTITTRGEDEDDAGTWEIGLALRWYAQRGQRGRVSWRLAELDGKANRTVGGVARRSEDGRELELWLGGLKVLETYIQDPGLLARWLDGEARIDPTDAQGGHQ